MWVKLVLCFLVGFACASHNPGWRHNYEYVYQVRGRTLTSLNQINSNYTGILLKAKLTIRPTSEGNLRAKISEGQYANIHKSLEDGWDQEIPDSELSYKNIPLPGESFEIIMNNGAVKDLLVKKSIKNWQSNIIKGIVSQLQLDTNGENIIDSSINVVTVDDAVFKAMEKTVTGNSETLYEIHPLPEYILQTTPWLVPLRKLKGNGKVFEVVKNKNFTHSKDVPSYHFGYHRADDFDINNKIGDFFSRTSVSRAVATGTLKSFTLQSSVTVDQVIMNPTGQDKQKGSTNSIVNITLLSLSPKDQEFEPVSDPINVGLVYRYNRPYHESNGPYIRRETASFQSISSISASAEASDDESLAFENSNILRRKRGNIGHSRRLSEASDSDESDMEDYQSSQEKPHIDEAPPSPLLPLTVGYDGRAISMVQNIEENARTLAKVIGQEYQKPEHIPTQNTLGKFLLLTNLVKVMNKEQMENVANRLYTQEQHGAAAAAWFAYRDAVAQAGTGPALLNIVEFIRQHKISGKEAAEVVATAANSARQPTEKYMKVFFEMIQNDQTMAQRYLNESLLLSYTTLVSQVYVNKDDSHGKYPVHVYGSFDTVQGELFVEKVVIPHLRRKLEEAVSRSDTKQIHVYIRALGNIGHRRVLQTFKPYLEGTKKASHFQRILMVVALDQLARNNPKVARSVLFRIYQNPRDFEQVRVAAVYQLMRASPTPEMLQLMAKYTKVDTNNHVNAAVKSVIESASELQGAQHHQLRVAARSAKALLTSQEFGIQHSQARFRNYVAAQAQLEVEQTLHTLGGEDSVFPKGINYLLSGRFGGMKEHVVNVQSMVSSVEDLINVYEQQTKEFRQKLRNKQASKPVNIQWSSDYTANLLNMKNEQREQLEGNMYLHLGAFHKMWSFDNHTIENLTEVVQELEEELQQGKHLDYSKMEINSDSALAFPTAWGLPFIFTFDIPTMVHFEADLKAIAQPSVYSDDGLQRPETVTAEYQVAGFLSGRVQSQFGIFAPFNQIRYSAGYDKNFQVVLPKISGKINLNVLKSQATVEIENSSSETNTNLLHYSSWPYTAQNEIYTLEPDTQIISNEYPQRIHAVFGQKATGIAFNLEVISDQTIDYTFLYNQLCRKDFSSVVFGSWLDQNIQHVQINVGIDSAKSITKRMFVHVGHQQTPAERSYSPDRPNVRHTNRIAQESWERQKEFLKNSIKDISNAHGQVVDAVVVFDGQQNVIEYSTTLANARSNIDPKGRVLMQVKQDNNQDKPLKIKVSSESHAPNPNSLDLDRALEFNSTMTAQIRGTIERTGESPSQINAYVKLSKSEDRIQYLKDQQRYKQCKTQMNEGNKQLSDCSTLTAQANLLDQFSINIDYENIGDTVVNRTYKLYSMLRNHLYPRVYENIQIKSQRKRLDIEGQFSSDLSTVNASIQSDYGFVEINNVQPDTWSRSILLSHPGYRTQSRLLGYALNYDTFQPLCVVDKSAANSFDNKTFPINFNKDWVVLLHYVPRRPSSVKGQIYQTVVEQLDQQVEGYIVYGRAAENDQSQKEIKTVIQSPNTNAMVIDITLKPSSSPDGYPRLFIDNEEIIYDDEGTHMYDGYMQVYKLPHGEIKVDVYDSFYVIYDGVRAKLTLVNDKYRDASRGLCGTFTEEAETDFIHPGNCIIHNPEVFVSTNTISEKQRTKRMNEMLMIQAEEKKCYQKKVGFVEVVSFEDIKLANSEFLLRSTSDMEHRTQYVKQGRETCFSILPLPTCKSGYRPTKRVSKMVSVHCVASSGVAVMMREKIDRGANPSFRNKPPSRDITMRVAQKCELKP